MKTEEIFGTFARRLAAHAMTASLTVLSFPRSVFMVDNTKLSPRHPTAESGITVLGDVSVQVFLTSVSDSYSLERNGEKQGIRLVTLPDVVRAQYDVDSAYMGQATINLYDNGVAKINTLRTTQAVL